MTLAVGCGRKPTMVELQPRNLELHKKGETGALNPTVKDSKGDPIEGTVLVWSSSDVKIATVAEGGKVTAVTSGRATITAAVGEIRGTSIVRVSIPTTVKFESEQLMIRGAGQSSTVVATVYDDKATMLPDAKVTWASSKPEIATVSAEGAITGVADGSAEITATAGEATGKLALTVKAPEASKITLDPATVVVKVKQSQSIAVLITDDQGLPMTDAHVVWTSADPSIAQVDEHGMVTGLRRGETMITAAAGTAQATAEARIR